jgi:hypothetical protein
MGRLDVLSNFAGDFLEKQGKSGCGLIVTKSVNGFALLENGYKDCVSLFLHEDAIIVVHLRSSVLSDYHLTILELSFLEHLECDQMQSVLAEALKHTLHLQDVVQHSLLFLLLLLPKFFEVFFSHPNGFNLTEADSPSFNVLRQTVVAVHKAQHVARRKLSNQLGDSDASLVVARLHSTV